MLRVYDLVLSDHVKNHKQMIFIVGPRQVGKTTISQHLRSLGKDYAYFNWDDESDQRLILQGSQKILEGKNLLRSTDHKIIMIFDEIHKYKNWRTFLKGLYDKHAEHLSILVTGSSQLDAFRSDGDSLMGRYLLYKIHPITLAELAPLFLKDQEISPPKQPLPGSLKRLIDFGGFPDPFLKKSEKFHRQWNNLRSDQLFYDEVRSLMRIQDIASLKLLGMLLKEQCGQLVTYSSLATKIKVSVDTIISWIALLKAFYYCYTIQPWSKNISRALIKQPKLYLWDWSVLNDIGALHENLIASHLMKAIDYWNNRGLGTYGLYFVRDKEQNEVDFLVTKEEEPWFLVEVKSSSNQGISKALYKMQDQLKAPHAFQVCFDLPYIDKNCFEYSTPIMVSAETFLSQLV